MEFIVVQGNKPLNLNNRKPLRSVTKAEHRQSLLSEDVINITVESKTPLALQVGNYIEYENRRYTLNSAPKVKKEQGYYTYDLVFEGVQYLLRDKVYFNLDAQGFQNTADFPLTGEINIFLTTLITNINSISDFTWVLGEYPQNTETKTLTFNNENCLAVLQKICQEYDTEFEIKQDLERKSYTLNIKKIGETLNQTFEYGKGNGLYSLSRENVNDSVVTRLYVFGSTNNIKSGYRDYSQRLRLPISHGKDYIQDDAKVKLFGLKEGVKIFDDIKPTFKGIVSGVINLENGSQEIVVSNMDFDLNETDSNGTKYLLNDTPAKLHVNKGNLAGYEFEILKNGGYNHATKTFRVKQFTDERGQKFPEAGSVFSFAVGDEVTLLDIALPEQYITNAENKLLEEGQKEYEKQSVNNLKYNLELDPLYLQQIGASTSIFFKIGDYIRVVDEPLKIDKTTRIVDITRDLLDKYDCKIGIADTYEISFVASLLTNIKDTKTVIKTQEQISRQNYLNGYRNLQELRESVFDVEGYFDPTHIKPESIEANMLSVGAKSQQFVLENISLNPNIEGNPARTFISGGKLVHFSLEDDIREWNLLPYSCNDLLNQVYYVYAKCSRGNSMGVWHITTEKIKFDSRSDYYYFLCYLLYTPKDGKREAEAMYGNVFMHGGQITAGIIKSLNGQTYFDLDSGEIAGTIKFKSGNGYAEVGSAIQQAETNATQVSNAYTLTQSTLAREEAKAHAQTLVDAVQVGGRNLVFNSNFATNSFSGWSSVYGAHEITNGIYKKTITAESGASRLEWIRSGNNSSISENGDYVLTLRYKTTHQLVARNFNGATLQDTVIPPSENFKEVSIPFTVTDFNSLIIRLYVTQPNNGAIIEIDWWKVEKGNKATNGFTPAPEDIQSDITRAEQQATQASNAYAQAQANLAKTQAEAYADGKVSQEEQRAIADAQQKLQLAKEYAQAQDNLKETLIKAYADGKADKAEQSAIAVAEAKANLARLQAEAHADSIVTAEEQARINEAKAKLEEAKAHAQALVNTHRNEVASKFNNLGTMAWQNSVERAMLGSTIVQGGYIKTELLNASAIVSNGGGATSAELNNAINSIIIGGRNLMLTPQIIAGYVVRANTSTPLIEGQEYAISFDIKGRNNGNLFLNNSIRVNIPINPNPNEWFRISKVFTFIKNDYQGKEILPHIYGATDVRNVKLEKGNKATDYTPAPEDLDALFANLQQGIANMQTSLSDVKTKTDNFASIQGGLMMANLMSVGSNQANQNAFISGITDEGAMSVRFGAGANYANKHNAPFRVLDNGKMIAQDADITGRITATGGNIGDWEINGSSFKSSSINNNDSWAQYSNYALFSPDMFLIRKNGSERGETKEVMMGITSSVATGSEGATAAIKSNIKKTQYDFDRDNVALRLEAKNGVTNTALDILNGDIRVGGEVGYTGELFFGGVWLTIRKGIITNYS
ncbi:hypothetical protein PG310_04560 [Riemerella anatipestifer]|uniref:phage tail spike protein n=1 Tax=Riemerella anatipestifer TaxID=34085 RepID=UPI002A89AC81|nr:hypothetical protein [Riemerella anatipestifer]